MDYQIQKEYSINQYSLCSLYHFQQLYLLQPILGFPIVQVETFNLFRLDLPLISSSSWLETVDSRVFFSSMMKIASLAIGSTHTAASLFPACLSNSLSASLVISFAPFRLNHLKTVVFLDQFIV